MDGVHWLSQSKWTMDRPYIYLVSSYVVICQGGRIGAVAEDILPFRIFISALYNKNYARGL